MKLKKYFEKIKKLISENPEILEYNVVYSSDDEGNTYSEVHFTPSIGNYDNEEFKEESDEENNAICIN